MLFSLAFILGDVPNDVILQEVVKKRGQLEDTQVDELPRKVLFTLQTDSCFCWPTSSKTYSLVVLSSQRRRVSEEHSIDRRSVTVTASEERNRNVRCSTPGLSKWRKVWTSHLFRQKSIINCPNLNILVTFPNFCCSETQWWQLHGVGLLLFLFTWMCIFCLSGWKDEKLQNLLGGANLCYQHPQAESKVSGHLFLFIEMKGNIKYLRHPAMGESFSTVGATRGHQACLRKLQGRWEKMLN